MSIPTTPPPTRLTSLPITLESVSSPTPPTSVPCRLDEITQYTCEQQWKELFCYPIFRRFLRCEGHPNLEITPSSDGVLSRPYLRPSTSKRIEITSPPSVSSRSSTSSSN
ncbi:hypothetical protein HMI54_002503 [Coelomomyces lativittatus]|nr:hypothetical protein HMI54_002503 [Coelomomyces lativittatus]KAJ1511190.1 hypothetical protein HMI56_005702 [Coelomomyces lativittatus]KAJ1514813.1 hypothetical protein HMI55_004328 [Coelomomyces lativittatus]